MSNDQNKMNKIWSKDIHNSTDRIVMVNDGRYSCFLLFSKVCFEGISVQEYDSKVNHDFCKLIVWSLVIFFKLNIFKCVICLGYVCEISRSNWLIISKGVVQCNFVLVILYFPSTPFLRQKFMTPNTSHISHIYHRYSSSQDWRRIQGFFF